MLRPFIAISTRMQLPRLRLLVPSMRWPDQGTLFCALQEACRATCTSSGKLPTLRVFDLEYGYSTMGYECAAGIGAKMACPDREIVVMVGDGNYLMMNSEIVTAVQEGVKYTIVLLNNNGFGSIGALSQSLGLLRFGTNYRQRDEKTGQLTGNTLFVDYVKNAQSLGADVIEVKDIPSLKIALVQARANPKITVVVIHTDIKKDIPGYAWWEVPVAGISEMPTVNEAYQVYTERKKSNAIFYSPH